MKNSSKSCKGRRLWSIATAITRTTPVPVSMKLRECPLHSGTRSWELPKTEIRSVDSKVELASNPTAPVSVLQLACDQPLKAGELGARRMLADRSFNVLEYLLLPSLAHYVACQKCRPSGDWRDQRKQRVALLLKSCGLDVAGAWSSARLILSLLGSCYILCSRSS